MKNWGFWLTTIAVLILFVLGLTYYSISDTVVNPVAFILTFVIIFVVLILLIISSFSKPKKKLKK